MSRIARLILCICLTGTTSLSADDAKSRGQAKDKGRPVTDRRSTTLSRPKTAASGQRKQSRPNDARKRDGAAGSKQAGQGKSTGNRPQKNGNRPNPQRRKQILERFDQNGNGKLDPDERAAAMKELKSRRDGKAGGSDKQGKRPNGNQPNRDKASPGKSSDRRAQIPKKFYKNGDGQLDQSERQAAMKAMRDRRSSGNAPKRKGTGNQRKPKAEKR